MHPIAWFPSLNLTLNDPNYTRLTPNRMLIFIPLKPLLHETYSLDSGPWIPDTRYDFCASQTLYLLSSAPSSQLNLYPWHQWRHLSKTDDVIMMSSLTLYPQAIIFKCIKYAKCFYFSRTGPVRSSSRSVPLFRSKWSKLSPNFFFSLKIWTPKMTKRRSFDFLLTFWQSVLLHTSSKSISHLQMTSSFSHNDVTMTL